jgi:predicted transcriptional regulator
MRRLLRAFLRSTPGRTILVVLVAALAWQGYLYASAGSKVDAEVAAEVEAGEPVRVTVVLGFTPERFHTLYLRAVRPENIARLARVYWIDRLEPVAEEDR